MPLARCQFRLAALLSSLALLPLPAAETPVQLDPVAVTGTRLGRPLEDSPINFTVIPREALELAGRTRLGEVLRELPEFAGNPVTDMVAFNESRGVSAFDLRGLGNGSTLILVNGRRTTVNANAFDLIRTYVDMNRFSPAFVERVEILKSGASAVYGADAVGGVVNLLTRRRPTGGEASLSYGNTFRSDAAEWSASLAQGATRGRLGLSVGVDYSERNAQAHRDRAFTRTANLLPAYVASYDYYGRLPPDQLAGFDGRSLISPQARFSVAPGQTNGRNGVDVPGLTAGAPIVTLPGTRSAGGAALAGATPAFDRAPVAPTGGRFDATAAATFVAPELTRGDPAARNLFDFNRQIWTTPEANHLGLTLRVDHEIAPAFAWFASLDGGRNRSRTEYHPRDYTGTVPRTNAFNPFGVDVIAAWRIPDAGPRRSLTENDFVSGEAGARGRLGPRARWEVAGTFSRDEYLDVTRGVYDAAKVRAALASTTPTTALNPFGGAGFRHDPALIDSLATAAWFGGVSSLRLLDAQVSGRPFSLPAGPVRTALFAEHRREEFSSVSDAHSRSGNILGYGQAGADVAFARTVRAVAAEVHVPLLDAGAGRGGAAPRLAVEGAVRREEFSSSFASGAKPSAGVVGRPGAGWTVRASGAWTFRGPSLPQLYSPQTDTYYNSVPDPRRPVALTRDDFDGPNVPRLVRQGGNPDLAPETGRTWQAGATWSPLGRPETALEATWFRYELEDLISGVSPGYVLDQELGGLGSLVHREAGTQTVTNSTGGPISVLSGPNGARTAVAPGQSIAVPGRLARLDIYTVNLSRRVLVGWDFGARQAQPFAGGRLATTAAVTYTDRNAAAYDRHTPLYDGAGTAGSPRWRGRATADWQRGRWSFGTTLTYLGSSGHHAPFAYYQKPYRVVHLRAGYAAAESSWLRGTQFTLGLDDVFDETPPLFPDPPIGFSYANISRPQGRFGRLTVRRRW
jgi:iron complex outermembrane receptor protein